MIIGAVQAAAPARAAPLISVRRSMPRETSVTASASCLGPCLRTPTTQRSKCCADRL
jgi:hypothetical protein